MHTFVTLRTFQRQSLVMLFFGLVAFIILFPILYYSGQKAAGFDYFNYNWNFWWIRFASTTGKNIFETNYVFAHTLHLNNLGYHAFTFFWYPLWALLEPFIGTFNAVTVIIAFGCLLNGYLTFHFLRGEKISWGVALLGGVVMQATPLIRYFYYNTHLNLMDWFWLPVQLYLWQRVVQSAHTSRGLSLLFWSVVQGFSLWALTLTDHQFPIFVAFLLVPYGLYTLWNSPHKLRLIGAGVIIVSIAVGLLWFAGPLPYILRFKGTLAPGEVSDRPGIPFPRGYLSADSVWWFWNVPTLGGFVTLITASVMLFLLVRRRHLSKELWLWCLLLIPPFILSLGPQWAFGTFQIPLPFRALYTLTNGMFKMPWRLAPIYLFAATVFVAKVVSPYRFTKSVPILTGLFFLLVADARFYQWGPLKDIPPQYNFYQAMRQETEDYVVVDVPTGVGTGEQLVGTDDAITLQLYAMTHQKRTVNGFISRAPVEDFWPLQTDDPMLSWLGQRRQLDADFVEHQLRERIPEWPIGYIVIHTDLIGADQPATQEIIGYFNAHDDLLCPVWVEGAAVVYRTRWHPAGCPPRTPQTASEGVYRIDVGSASDQRFIGWGWHQREDVNPDTNWRWTGYLPEAKLYVDLPAGTYEVTLSAQAFWENRQLSISINDQPLDGQFTIMPNQLQVFTTTIPAAVVGTGQHLTLTLTYDKWVVPEAVGQSADTRKLAVSVDWIEFKRIGD